MIPIKLVMISTFNKYMRLVTGGEMPVTKRCEKC